MPRFDLRVYGPGLPGDRRRITGQFVTDGPGFDDDGDFGFDDDEFDVDPEVGGTIWGNQRGASFLSPRTPVLPY
ncbi:hypothetical protein [Terribacillus aidingensis]|uniref:hypothetical protein n=1 Tax=Terribacillus aidingensis TaxID=586416 RepID=UPI00344C2483